MVRKLGTVIFAALFSVVIFVASPQSAAAIVAGNYCGNNHTAGEWNSTHEFAYLTNKNITVNPTWCIINVPDNMRLVFQPNGDLVVWTGIHSGGHVVWQSHTGNIGATQLRFQSDGNVVVYAGSKALWAASWKGGMFQQCGTGNSYALFLNSHYLDIMNNGYCPTDFDHIVARY
jgi:hypothetical protein